MEDSQHASRERATDSARGEVATMVTLDEVEWSGDWWYLALRVQGQEPGIDAVEAASEPSG